MLANRLEQRSDMPHEAIGQAQPGAPPWESALSPKQKSPAWHWAFLTRNWNGAYTLNEDPQPQVFFTFGFSNLKPAPSRVSR